MTVEHVDSLMPEIEPTETPEQLPDVEVTTDPPADKEAQARGDDGKFKGKEPTKEPAKEPAKVEPKQRQEHVPLATYLEEKKARQTEVEQLRAQLAALQNPPKAPPAEPDFTADPKGYADHKAQTVLEKLEALKTETAQKLQTVEQTAQQTAQQTEQQQFLQAVSAAEAEFVKTQPDYYDAVNHIRQVRLQQLQIFSPDMPPEQMWATIRSEEIGMATQLARSGRNPITEAYRIAKVYGYQPKQSKAAEPALELPKVPGQRQLPPDQTLGSGAGGGVDEVEAESKDPFDDAFSEMFKRKRA